MKTIFAVLLLIILEFPLGMKFGLIVYFKLNQESIALNYCENKDKPEMECNGQCHLKKEFKKIEQIEEKSSDTEFPIQKIVESEIPVFLLNEYLSDEVLSPIQVAYDYASYFKILDGYRFNFCQESFHPPQV